MQAIPTFTYFVWAACAVAALPQKPNGGGQFLKQQ